MISIRKITELYPRSEILLSQIDDNAKAFGHHTRVLPEVQKRMMNHVLREEIQWPT